VIGDVRLVVVWNERGEGAGRSVVVRETQTKKKVGWLSRWKCVGRTVWFVCLFVVDVNFLFEFDQTLLLSANKKKFALVPGEQCVDP
jgi:hypothetical protein